MLTLGRLCSLWLECHLIKRSVLGRACWMVAASQDFSCSEKHGWLHWKQKHSFGVGCRRVGHSLSLAVQRMARWISWHSPCCLGLLAAGWLEEWEVWVGICRKQKQAGENFLHLLSLERKAGQVGKFRGRGQRRLEGMALWRHCNDPRPAGQIRPGPKPTCGQHF